MPVIAIGDVLAGIIVGVLLLAATTILLVAEHVLPDPGIFGFHPRDWLLNPLKSIASALGQLGKDLLIPLAWMTWGLAYGIWWVVSHVANAVTSLATTVYNLAGWVNQIGVTLHGYIDTEIGNVAGYANSLYNAVQARISTVYTIVESDIGRVENTIDNAVVGIQRSLLGQIQGVFNAVESDLSRVEQTLVDNVVGIEQTLQNDIAGVYNTITADISSTVTTVEGYVDGAVQTLKGDIAKAATAAEAAAIAGALAQTIPRITTLEAEATECLRPLCDTVTPNAGSLGRLGGLLANLETLGLEALVLAMLAEAVTHPDVVAKDVATVADDIGRPVLDGLRSLVGV